MKPLSKIARGQTGIQRQMRKGPVVGKTTRTGPNTFVTTGLKADTAYVATFNLDAGTAEVRKASAAVRKSRAKNPEKYRKYQREYMRKRRAKP